MNSTHRHGKFGQHATDPHMLDGDGSHDDSGRPTFVLHLGEAHGRTVSAHPDADGVVYRSLTMVYVATCDRDALGRRIARAMWD